jgi:hypothetical protein
MLTDNRMIVLDSIGHSLWILSDLAVSAVLALVVFATVTVVSGAVSDGVRRLITGRQFDPFRDEHLVGRQCVVRVSYK